MSTKYAGQVALNKLVQLVKTAINGKVDKVSGKGLSTNDYTTAEKGKLAGIEAGAEVNVQADWSATETTSDAYIKNKPTKLSQFSNDAGYVKQADIDFPEGAMPSTSLPKMDGTAAAGTEAGFSRGDHVHPSDTSKLSKAGDTMTGNLNMGGNSVSGLPAPTDDTDAVNKDYVDGIAPYIVTATVANGSATMSDTLDNVKAKLDAGVPVVGYIISEGAQFEASVSWGGISIEMASLFRSDGETSYMTVSFSGTGTTGSYRFRRVKDWEPLVVIVTLNDMKATSTYSEIKNAVDMRRHVYAQYFKDYTASGHTENHFEFCELDDANEVAIFMQPAWKGTARMKVDAEGNVTLDTNQFQTSAQVQELISSAISGVYTPKGTVTFANLPTAAASNKGWVYNLSDAFTTTASFVEGAGRSYGAGTNVVCVDAGSGTYKWDVLAGTIDLTELTEAEVQAIWDSI